jgi:predicted RNase H-like HicB family nuclease
MRKDTYSYIAVVSYDDDGISINFPDLQGCFTCADNEDEIFRMANEALRLHLWGMENDGELAPEPSPLNKIAVEKNETTIMVDAFMPPVRDRLKNRVVKRTLSLPQWLNAEAERHDVDISELLQNALIDYLQLAKQEVGR